MMASNGKQSSLKNKGGKLLRRKKIKKNVEAHDEVSVLSGESLETTGKSVSTFGNSTPLTPASIGSN